MPYSDSIYIVARVASNSIVREDNYLTIDRGGSHGVAPGMGVIASNGIVGVVRDTTRLGALVMSILHEQANISVSIRRNKFFVLSGTIWIPGICTWKIFPNMPIF